MFIRNQLIRFMKTGRLVFFVAVVAYFFMTTFAFGATIKLMNGDILHGEIVSEDTTSITVNSEYLGSLVIQKENVRKIADHALPKAIVRVLEKPEIESEWSHTVKVGYSFSSGTTDEQDLMLEGKSKWQGEKATVSFSGRLDYGEKGERLDTQQWILKNRDAYTFWEAEEEGLDRTWWEFLKAVKTEGFINIELDHDRFSDIDWRIVPTVGVSYWFVNNEKVKAYLDLGLGFSRTEFESNKSEETQLTVIPHFHLERPMWGKSKLVDDFTFYPSLEETEDYRYVNELKFSNPITDAASLELSWLHEFDNTGSSGTEKYDNKIVSSLSYSF